MEYRRGSLIPKDDILARHGTRHTSQSQTGAALGFVAAAVLIASAYTFSFPDSTIAIRAYSLLASSAEAVTHIETRVAELREGVAVAAAAAPDAVTNFSAFVRSLFSQFFTDSDVVYVAPPLPDQAPAGSPATSTNVAQQTVINQPVIERVIETERIVSASGVSEELLNARLKVLDDELSKKINTLTSANTTRITQVFETAGALARIERLDNLDLRSPTISGGTIKGISGLADADIPDGLTASNYLPLAGGALTGTLTGTNLTLSGNLTVSGAQTLSGAITIPYLSATSTTASTFIQASTTRFSVFDTAYFGGSATSTFDSAGNLSVAGTLGATGATTLGTLTATNATTTNATSTNLAVSGTASTSALVASNSFTFSNVTGFLKATAGVISSALVDLASNVTGILAVPNGGTGWAALQSGSVLLGNGTGAIATSSNLFWDNTNARLGIGTTSPWRSLSVHGSSDLGTNALAGSFTATTTATSTFPWLLSTNATTTNFAITGITSSLLKTNSTGGVVAAVAGTDYQTFGYPFPINATSTNLSFSGGLTVSGGDLNLSVGRRVVNTGGDLLLLGGGNNNIRATLTSQSVIGANNTSLRLNNAAGSVGIFESEGDTGTALASVGASTHVILAPNRVETLRATASGNVGIGTTTPNQKLSIFNSTADSAIEFSSLTGDPYKWTIGQDYSDGGKFKISSSTALGTSDRLVIDGSGNVGIGTTSPYVKFAAVDGAGELRFQNSSQNNLTITGTNSTLNLDSTSGTAPGIFIKRSGSIDAQITNLSGSTGLSLFGHGSGGTAGMFLNSSGNVGIGTTTPDIPLSVLVDANGNGLKVINRTTPGTEYLKFQAGGVQKGIVGVGTVPLVIDSAGAVALQSSAGSVGVGTTSPWRKLSVTGTVGFDGLASATGAGSLCLSSNKEVVYNASSDACLSSLRSTKHDITALALPGLATIEQLQPVSFVYNQSDGRTRYGFIAEDTAAVAAPLATYDASSTLSGIDDRAILSVVIKAIKELYAKLVSLTEKVAGFSESFTTRKLCVADEAGAETCVTRAQLDQLLANGAASGRTSANGVVPDPDPGDDPAAEIDPLPQEPEIMGAPPLAPEGNDDEVVLPADSEQADDPSAPEPLEPAGALVGDEVPTAQ